MPSSAGAAGGLALVGAGSLGQAFAALLARSGQPVTLLSTPGTLARLRETGRIRLRGAVTVDVPVGSAPGAAGVVGVTDDPAALPRGAGVLFAGDVGFHEAGVGAQFLGTGGAGLGVDVHQHHLAALPDQFAGGGQAEAGTAAGDQENGILDTHGSTPSDQ